MQIGECANDRARNDLGFLPRATARKSGKAHRLSDASMALTHSFMDAQLAVTQADEPCWKSV